VEHRLELDALRGAAGRMQEQLAEGHAQLAAEVSRRLAAEDAAARAAADAARGRELARQITAERWASVAGP
jgi:hypothetical protein